MRIVVSVEGGEQGGRADGGGVHGLRGWLAEEPALRGRVRRAGGTPEPGSMGVAAEALIALLEPGGVVAVFAGAVVAWVQTRRSSHTVTLTRPDGGRVTLSSRQVKGMTPHQIAELVGELAAAIDQAPAGTGAVSGTASGPGASGAGESGTGEVGAPRHGGPDAGDAGAER
ncbi:hypothetical protein RMN57_30110 [Kitasatospora sp. CM 4170]|uniref:Uncharacterized protein n=1 Tax=Kitasatospora aburaviensis TaxID=67265 RepID=A0ABW1ESI6_9ACTN|nr:hypothetical protein [Kitasatospora sp. CM 4170]WNM48645.1 hypothetical protein RMN57_30110 [Kitasatospora sp. CM 4170]